MALDVAMQSLTGIAIVLGVGLLVSVFSRKLRLASVLLLLLVGLGMNYISSIGFLPIEFSSSFVITIALLTLIIVVFDGSSRFKMRMIDEFSGLSLKLFSSFLLLSLVIISLVTSFLFFGSIALNYILLSSIFAIILVGTDPTSMFSILKNSHHKAIQLLEIESIINTPFTVILPFIAMQILTSVQEDVSSIVLGQISPLILQIAAGIGMGVLLGYLLSKMLKKYYSKDLSPIFLITFALVGYILTEYIGGSGVLGVATMGLFFGNAVIRKRDDLVSFNDVLSTIFVILVFILVGFIIRIIVNPLFLFKVFIIYLIAIVLRFISLEYVLPRSKFNRDEKIFMALMMPKGIAVAVVVLSMSALAITGLDEAVVTISAVIVMSMILSLLIATVLSKFDKFFLSQTQTEKHLVEEERKLKKKEVALEKEIVKKDKILQQKKADRIKKADSKSN